MDTFVQDKKPFYRDRKFYLFYFLPFFVVFAGASLLYSFLAVHDVYVSKGSFVRDDALISNQLRTISDAAKSDKVATNVATALATKKIYHADGSMIASSEFSSNVQTDYSIKTDYVYVSFTSRDSSITLSCVNEILDQTLSVLATDVPSLKNQVKVFEYASSSEKQDNYRYQYITAGCFVGLVLPIGLYMVTSRRTSQ